MSSRLLWRDVFAVGALGLSTRRMRAALSAVGVAIGIASMVAVLGISESSKADLLAQLDRLGTNLLTVTAGQSISAAEATLPERAPKMIGRVGAVEQVASVRVTEVTVRRTPYVAAAQTSGVAVMAADTNLLATLNGRLASGAFINEATIRYPAVVLGAVAAERLAMTTSQAGRLLYIGGRWFSLVGVLEPLPLAPDIDRAALIGYPVAKALFRAGGDPSTIHVRAEVRSISDVRALLSATANPENPEEVAVSRPSEIIEARAAAETAYTSLFLGLGAVALLVGGVGIANVMVISVLERRSEIGLRRALGATRPHITLQFLTESLLLAGIGGLAGALLGTAITFAYASSRDWQASVPLSVPLGGLGAALVIGVLAGLYPAVRAARLAPTDALRTV